MATRKEAGLPLAEGLTTAMDLPHTLTYAIMYRAQLDSFNELPKDKRPPRKLWDRPYELSQFLEKVWDTDTSKTSKDKDYYIYDLEEVE